MFAPQIDSKAWAQLALCADGTGALTELFFSEELGDIATAKRFCADCPVRVPCFEGALARKEPWGVWGGELFFQGKVLAQKRKRGRPPKVRPIEAEQSEMARETAVA